MNIESIATRNSCNPLDLLLRAEERGEYTVPSQREERTREIGECRYYDQYVAAARRGVDFSTVR
jgi:hypothetical protein